MSNQNSIRFPYGKYKGRLVSDILISDAIYVKWAMINGIITLPKMVKL